MTDAELIEAMRVEGGAADRGIWKLLGQAANRLEELVEHVADLKVERIGLTDEVYRLRSKIDDAWRCMHPVGQLAQHYIDAQAAAGDAWRERLGAWLDEQPLTDAEVAAAVARLPVPVEKWADDVRAKINAAVSRRPSLAQRREASGLPTPPLSERLENLAEQGLATPPPHPTVAEDARQRGIAYDLSRADEPAHATPPPTEHPDGCHTTAAAARDCDGDGHFTCASCTRLDRESRRNNGDPQIGGSRDITTPPPTVGELLARLPVVEWLCSCGRWVQRSAADVREWRDGAWMPWTSRRNGSLTHCTGEAYLPARLVSANKADESPDTRGEIR